MPKARPRPDSKEDTRLSPSEAKVSKAPQRSVPLKGPIHRCALSNCGDKTRMCLNAVQVKGTICSQHLCQARDLINQHVDALSTHEKKMAERVLDLKTDEEMESDLENDDDDDEDSSEYEERSDEDEEGEDEEEEEETQQCAEDTLVCSSCGWTLLKAHMMNSKDGYLCLRCYDDEGDPTDIPGDPRYDPPECVRCINKVVKLIDGSYDDFCERHRM